MTSDNDIDTFISRDGTICDTVFAPCASVRPDSMR
jgi:hypothetical protein